MPPIEFKRDLRVIIPYSLFMGALFILLFVKTITWSQFLMGVAALNVPAVFGLAKPPENPEPPAPSPPGPPPIPPASSLRRIWGFVVCLGLVVAGCHVLTTQERAIAAESAYTTEMLECVDKAVTLTQSRDCREQVRDRWAPPPRRDAGGDQ